MLAMGASRNQLVREAKTRVSKALRVAGFKVVDAGSVTTGKDYLLTIWTLAVSCPVGVAIVHESISSATMANIYYELGWMQAYGRETVVVKIGDPKLPSDLVRTEYIALDSRFAVNFRRFIRSLSERAGYYEQLAGLLRANPLLAIDYLRRAYLLTGKQELRREAKRIFEASELATRAPDSVEHLLAKF